VYCAVPAVGAVLHALNIRLFPEQLVFIANHAEHRVVFVDGSLLARFTKLLPAMRTVRHVVVVNGDPAALEASPSVAVHSYQELLADESTTFDFPVIDERSAAAMCSSPEAQAGGWATAPSDDVSVMPQPCRILTRASPRAPSSAMGHCGPAHDDLADMAEVLRVFLESSHHTAGTAAAQVGRVTAMHASGGFGCRNWSGISSEAPATRAAKGRLHALT
jgi:hypothetical protein